MVLPIYLDEKRPRIEGTFVSPAYAVVFAARKIPQGELAASSANPKEQVGSRRV